MARQQQITLLPPPLKKFLHLRGQEILGGSLFIIGIYIALALISHDATDPSINTAVNGAVHNLAGSYGSILADLCMQTFGGASFCFAGAFLAWGRLKFSHQPLASVWLKCACVLLAAMLLATFSGTFADSEDTLNAAPAGGFVGKLIVDWLAYQQLWGSTMLPHLAVALLSLAGAFSLLVYAYDIQQESLYAIFVYPLKSLLSLIQTLLHHAPWPLISFSSFALKRLSTKPKENRIEPPFAKGASQANASTQRSSQDADEENFQALASAMSSDHIEITLPAQVEVKKHEAAPSYRSLDLDENVEYHLPPLTLLSAGGAGAAEIPNEKTLEESARLLKNVLEEFGIRGEIAKIRPGPVVTLYELVPAPGIKTSRVISLADDIARSMSAVSARVAVIAGQNAIGIELPNQKRQSVFLRELLSTAAYERTGGSLPLILGKDIGGSPVIADLARMPHLLVAGTTGSGKSVAANSMILSLLFRLSPDACKFIMIDPKMLELSIYDGIPHLLTPVVTDPKKAVVALKWAVREMEERYRAMSKVGVRNIEGYNLRLKRAEDTGEALTRRVQTGFDPETGKPIFETQSLDLKPLPYIVVVVDEMADLMLVAGKDIEAAVQRLAQMARAAGIHLIMATQRPSVDVITGTIKANFPTRISFQVTSKIDSRTILGEQGAEQLLGQGDMLYMAAGGRITRVHGPFVSENEVEHVVQFLKLQGYPDYMESITEEDETTDSFPDLGSVKGELYQQAVTLVLRERKASTSFIQRHLQIGYNKAAGLIEQMEKDGVVGAANHVGKREILRDA